MYKTDVSYPFVHQPNQVSLLTFSTDDYSLIEENNDIEMYGFDLLIVSRNKAYTMKPYYIRNYGINRRIVNALSVYYYSGTPNDTESFVVNSGFYPIEGDGRIRQWELSNGHWIEKTHGYEYDSNGDKQTRDNMGVYSQNSPPFTFPSSTIDEFKYRVYYYTPSGQEGILGYVGYPEKYIESYRLNGKLLL